MNQETVSISAAAQLTKFSQRQLRNFHSKGYCLEPYNVVSGSITYRRYAPEHLENLKWLKKFLDEGFTLAAASKKAFEKIEKEEK